MKFKHVKTKFKNLVLLLTRVLDFVPKIDV